MVKKQKRPANQTQLEISQARAALLRFSPENPLVVGPIVHRQLSAYPELADLMDRVRINQPLPTRNDR